MASEMPTYGGQAVIEGVMMRGSRVCAVAVRAPDGAIVLDTQPLGNLYQTGILKVPFLRGLVVLWDSLVLGMRALAFSANVQAGEDEQLEGASLAVAMAISLTFGIGLFFLLPTGAAYLVERGLSLNPWLTNLLEGIVRLLLLLGYVWAIGFMPEIRRVYAYHGAEHMTINAFESGAQLNPETVARFPREHPRCGTAFLLTVVVFSVLLFSLVGPMPLLPRLLSRIALIPLLAALAYEYIRLSSRLVKYAWARPFIAPNLALQRLTTRKPDLDMLEVAIRAFRAMRAEEASPIEREEQPL